MTDDEKLSALMFLFVLCCGLDFTVTLAAFVSQCIVDNFSDLWNMKEFLLAANDFVKNTYEPTVVSWTLIYSVIKF